MKGTTHSETDSALQQRIRRLARKQGLVASKSRKDGKWYFADDRNWLQSPESGLNDEEALAWLRE